MLVNSQFYFYCSPRYTERLARKIDLLGGARFMFLTHKYDWALLWVYSSPCQLLFTLMLRQSNVLFTRDDVADHEKWSKRLKCVRILHSKDVMHLLKDIFLFSFSPLFIVLFRSYNHPSFFLLPACLHVNMLNTEKQPHDSSQVGCWLSNLKNSMFA